MSKRCPTGKYRHGSKVSACIAARKISKVVMNVYLCPSCKGWHIGHTNDPGRLALRIDELLRAHKRSLDARLSASAAKPPKADGGGADGC